MACKKVEDLYNCNGNNFDYFDLLTKQEHSIWGIPINIPESKYNFQYTSMRNYSKEFMNYVIQAGDCISKIRKTVEDRKFKYGYMPNAELNRELHSIRRALLNRAREVLHRGQFPNIRDLYPARDNYNKHVEEDDSPSTSPKRQPSRALQSNKNSNNYRKNSVGNQQMMCDISPISSSVDSPPTDMPQTSGYITDLSNSSGGSDNSPPGYHFTSRFNLNKHLEHIEEVSSREESPVDASFIKQYERTTENSHSSTPKKKFIKRYCEFCRRNGEHPTYLKTHTTRNHLGEITCPVLIKHVCDICGATGKFAHTRKYCPKYVASHDDSAHKFRLTATGNLSVANFHK